MKITTAYDKVEGPDLEALNAAINAAIKLKRSEYTPESWNALQAILTAAKTAKNADNQSAIDVATEALNKAIAGLVKVADEAVTPTVKPVAPESDEAEAEEKGCGSVIGGVAVMLTSIIALAGVTFMKKED